MKLNVMAWFKRDEGEIMARFGEARLVKKVTGKIELLGGSAVRFRFPLSIFNFAFPLGRRPVMVFALSARGDLVRMKTKGACSLLHHEPTANPSA